MTLLQDRAKAQRHLDFTVKNLLELSDWDNKYHSHPHKRLLQSDKYIRLCKQRAKIAKSKLEEIDRKLYKVGNHAISPRLEMIAKLMTIFKPDSKDEIEELITFT